MNVKIAFASNFYNHHQGAVSAALNWYTNGNYYFVETKRVSQMRNILIYGRDLIPDYVLRTYESQVTQERGLRMINDADVVIACLCQAFGGVYNTAIRVGYYFMIYLAILLPRLVANVHARAHGFDNQRIALLMYIGILACFGAFGLYLIKNGSWAMAAPYSFFWQ